MRDGNFYRINDGYWLILQAHSSTDHLISLTLKLGGGR